MTSTNEHTLRTAGTDVAVPESPAETPLTDIYETPEAYIVHLDLPGAVQGSVKIQVDAGTLAVNAALPNPGALPGTLVHTERSARGYRRSFVLGEGIDRDRIEARYDMGVLTLTLWKSEAAKPKDIPIR